MSEPAAPDPLVALIETVLVAVRASRQPAPLPPSPPEYLSVADFAARLQVTPRAVRAMLKDGMPYLRPRPRLIRIPVAGATAWIADRTKTAGAVETEARRRATLDAHRGDIH